MPLAPAAHTAEKPAAPKVQQPLLPLDPVTRGRFDKIEPTIVEGQDLDVPTFLRMKLKK
jgi:cell division protein FtsZ